ncbi:MAG: hypothetical protein MUC66_01260 [Methanolinea sp.]|nr:hypothetical protein [Methanolinea sp.]
MIISRELPQWYSRGCIISAALLLLLLLVMPGAAAVQEQVYLGRITALDPLSNTLTIRAESQYSCDYSSGNTICRFTSMTPLQVVGSVTDEGIYNTFRNGDQVVATIMGGSGGSWVGIALVTPTPGIENWMATEIYGDPRSLPVLLAGDYLFEYTTIPDCSRCTGSVCKALSAHIILKSAGIKVLDQSLNSGQSTKYSGRNDGSSVSVLYLTGEAEAGQCSQAGPIAGIQPISNFIIHVVPPIGLVGSPGVITQPTAEGIEPKVTPQSTPAPTQAISGYLLPAGAICILALGLRRRFL